MEAFGDAVALAFVLWLCVLRNGMLFMLLAYRHGSLSVLHPMLSVGYVFSLILAATVLKEAVSPLRILGVAVILVGVIFIGGGDD